jgi:Cu/Ag efflux protein CusF
VKQMHALRAALRTGLAATLGSVALFGCGTTGQTAAPLPGGKLSEGLVTSTARVKSVDQKTRMVTLETADGGLVKFRAGDQVRNLAQVKVGDEVTASYYESVAFQVRKAGESELGTEVGEQAARAKLGDKPGMAGARVITVTTKIIGIDKQAGTVTLQDEDGESVTVKARNPENLERVAVGDLVEITRTEAVGISVQEPTD